MDLADNALTRIDEQIPVNFSEAFTQLYEISFEKRNTQDRLFKQTDQISREVHSLSQRLLAIEKAIVADLNTS